MRANAAAVSALGLILLLRIRGIHFNPPSSSSRSSAEFREHGGKGGRKRMHISRPARRHVAAIAYHPSGPFIAITVAKQAGGFSEVIAGVPWNIAEIGR